MVGSLSTKLFGKVDSQIQTLDQSLLVEGTCHRTRRFVLKKIQMD